MTIDPRILELAEVTLTERQYDIWRCHQNGQSQRAIAYRLDLSRTTITDTLDAANRRLRSHGVRFTADGHPYLQETA